MSLRVDIATGTQVPKYTAEVVARFPSEMSCRILNAPGYGTTQLATAYRVVHHTLSILRRRREGAVLHVDTQLLAYILAFKQRSPTVLRCHDLAQFHPEFDDPSYVSRREPANRAFAAMLARGIQRATRILAVSSFVREELLRRGFGSANRIDVVHNGVDLDAYHPRPRDECASVLTRYGLPGNRRVILYVGTDHPRKNLSGLLRAFARIQAPEVILVRVGLPREPQNSQLLALATSLGISARVVSVREVREPDLPLLYGAADLVVLPSFYEGFGLPPLEAMACGTPVAVAKAASIPEVVADAGLYFNPYDEKDIASGIEHLLEDRSLQEDLRARGLARARSFTWDRAVGGFLNAYRLVLERAS